MNSHGEPIICTVVIINWNSWDILSCCLEKLQSQTLNNFNIIVIDNASELPASMEFISRYPCVTLLRYKSNLGFAAANNLAIADCNTEFLALLNPDAFPEPTWLESLVLAANSNPKYHFFASRQLMEAKLDRIDGCGDAYHVSGLHWRSGHGKNAQGYAESSSEVFGACAAAALFRTKIIRQIGGFDESFFCYAEDVDLAFRLRLKGYRCLYVPEAIVYHIGSATTGKHSDFSVYHGHRNLVWVYFKNMPWPLFWLYLPQHLLINILTIILYIARGQGRIILKAKWDAIKGLPRILRERRKVQAARVVSSMALRKIMARGLIRK